MKVNLLAAGAGTRVTLQAEASECGLACLVMIAERHGYRQSLQDIRRKFPVSLTGTSLKALAAIADSIGFTSRAVRCDLHELSRLTLPAILHWDLDHYVVLHKINKNRVVILDPARGERVYHLDEVSKHFTGVAVEFTPAPSFEKRDTVERVRIGDLWSRISGFAPVLIQLFVLAALLQGLGLIAPLSSQIVIDEVVTKGDKSLLNVIIIGFGAIALVQTAIEFLRGMLQLHAGQILSLQLSGNLLRHLLHLKAEYFERRHIGDVVTRFSSLGAIEKFITGGVVSILLDGIMIVPLGIMMAMYSVKLSLLVALSLAISFIFRAITFPINRNYADEQMSLSAKTQSVFLETIRAIRAIKIAGRENERHAVWQNATTDQLNNSYRQSKFHLVGGAGLGVLQAAQALFMLYVGALQIIDGKLTLGMFFAFQSYAAQFSGRASGLIEALFTFRMIGLHLERLADVVHADQEQVAETRIQTARPFQGEIEMSGVSFRYSPNDPWVFRDLNLHIRPGERIAIVGPSGGGKTTMLKLLMGLYSPTEGEIRIDGLPLALRGLSTLRKSLGVVMQDDQLLSGTIADNVCFFDPEMNMERVEEACRLACVHEEILAKPMGYYSLIGDMGSILSGGQKQRILLARAIYKKPTMIIMDEGTANMDPDLETKIMKNLSRLSVSQVMVAHRPAVVAFADTVVRLEDGAISDVSNMKTVAEMMARL